MKRWTIILLVAAGLASAGCATSRVFLRQSFAVGTSVTCAGMDLGTTMYDVAQGSGREANGILAPRQNQPLLFTARKAALEAPVDIYGAWLFTRNPVLARVLLYSNAALKCGVALHNDSLRRPVR